MNKYILLYLLVFVSPAGFTQMEMYPCFSTFKSFNAFSLTDCNSEYSPYGLLYYTLYTGSETDCSSLSGIFEKYLIMEYTENESLISRNFLTCLQSWMCSSILFPDDNLGYYLTFGRLCLDQFEEFTNPSQSNPNLQSSYGIKYRLTGNEESPSQNLLYYEKPVFDVSTLHKEEVVKELLKQLRRQDFDFSGVIQDFYRPSTMPGID